MEELRRLSTSQSLRYVRRPRLNWFLEAYESGLRAAASTAGQAIS
jgi:hypothetical protein